MDILLGVMHEFIAGNGETTPCITEPNPMCGQHIRTIKDPRTRADDKTKSASALCELLQQHLIFEDLADIRATVFVTLDWSNVLSSEADVCAFSLNQYLFPLPDIQ